MVSRLNALLLVVLCTALVSACSGGETSAPASRDLIEATTTTSPDSLAFADDEADSDAEDEVVEEPPLEPRTLRVSVPTFRFVSPELVDESDAVDVMITDLLTDGLTRIDPATGSVEPLIADGWSVSPDRLTWTFMLGSHEFSTGEAIEAADVVASLGRVAALGADSITGPHLGAVDGWFEPSGETVRGLAVIDEETVQITLTRPEESLLELLAAVPFGIFPAEAEPDGTLPLSSSTTMTPTALWDDGFRLEASTTIGLVDSIDVLMDPELTMLAVSETDVAVGFDAVDAPLGAATATAPTAQRVYFGMNHDRAPFDDPAVREAIVKAVDTEALIDEFFPLAGVMTSFVDVGGECSATCHDPDRAAQIVAEIDVEASAFTVDYFVVDGDDREQRIAEAIVSQLRTVGFVATARAHPIESYGQALRAGDLGLFRFGTAGGSASAERMLGGAFHSSGVDNVFGVADSDLDDLISVARSTDTASEQRVVWSAVDDAIVGEWRILPVASLRSPLALGERVAHVQLVNGGLDLGGITWIE